MEETRYKTEGNGPGIYVSAVASNIIRVVFTGKDEVINESLMIERRKR